MCISMPFYTILKKFYGSTHCELLSHFIPVALFGIQNLNIKEKMRF